MGMIPGRYEMTIYPCGCSICRMRGKDVVMSVGVCEQHQPEPSVALGMLAGVVAELAQTSGLPMLVDTVQMGEDFVDFVQARRDELEAMEEGVDGSA